MEAIFKPILEEQSDLCLNCLQFSLQPFDASPYEPRSEKTGLRGFLPGPTQTGLCNHRR